MIKERGRTMRVAILAAWLGTIFTGITWFFWQTELKYQLPTPVPVHYHAVNKGETVNLQGKISATGKPVFIHFFNPTCPCSRFNARHVEALAKKHGNDFDFVIVALDKNGKSTVEGIQETFGMKVPVLFDSTVAAACGVYSTPQAVILDKEHKLYYRGNYNRSRYCTDKNTEYARMAIDSFLNNESTELFGKEASIAYGCQLPATCTK